MIELRSRFDTRASWFNAGPDRSPAPALPADALPPSVHIDDAARRALPTLTAPSGVVDVTDGRRIWRMTAA